MKEPLLPRLLLLLLAIALVTIYATRLSGVTSRLHSSVSVQGFCAHGRRKVLDKLPRYVFHCGRLNNLQCKIVHMFLFHIFFYGVFTKVSLFGKLGCAQCNVIISISIAVLFNVE